MHSLFFEGLILQASLIFALGAQNIFVLESGLKKQNPIVVSFVCFFCDLLLIMLGVAGAGTLFATFSQLKILIGVIGVFFLFQYGLSKIFIPQETFAENSDQKVKLSIKRSIILSITFSILNPHAYLDAFVLIGGYSSKYEFLSERMAIGLGAAFFSLIWFLCLSSASTMMKPIFVNNRSYKYVSLASGLLLIFMSYKLGQDVYSWIMEGPHSEILVRSVEYPLPSGLLYSAILY